MIAQPIGTQFTLQFLVAILAFASFAVLVINAFGQRASARTVGNHGAAIGALGRHFALDDDPTRLLPRVSLIVETREEPLWLACCFVLFNRVSQEFFAVSLDGRIHGRADRVLNAQPFAGIVEPSLGVAGIRSQVNQDVRELGSQRQHDTLQIAIDSQSDVGRAMQ